MIAIIKNRLELDSKRNHRGVAAVELAFLIIPLLLITAGIVEFGRVFWYYDALSKATRDGARYLSQSPQLNLTNTTNMVNYAVNQANVRNFNKDNNVLITCTAVTTPEEPEQCDSTTFVNASPLFVTVSIVNYSVSIGSWIPLISGTNPLTVSLTPATTMRYIP